METMTTAKGILLKGRRNSILNNTLLFILAYVIALYVMQLGTAMAAFILGIPMILHATYIDFDTLNTSASDEIWASSDNVINVFGAPLFALVILIMISGLLISVWRTNKLNIQRFLFWLIVCSFVRMGGNFIAGHICHLWNVNLVTDFLGITYPSQLGKFAFIALVLVALFVCFRIVALLVKYVINTFGGRLKEDYICDMLVPCFIGGVVVLVFALPASTSAIWNEVIGVLILWLGMSFVVMPKLIKRYKFVEQTPDKEVEKEKPNIVLLAVVLVGLIALKVVLTHGIEMKSSAYKHYILENVLMVSFGLVLLLFVVYLYFSYRRKKRLNEQKAKEYEEFLKPGQDVFTDEQWGVKQYDMSKYEDEDSDD